MGAVPYAEPVAAPNVPTGRRLTGFQASLVELAGAVRNARRSAVGAQALGVPPFVADPACHEAVVAGVLRPGSAADHCWRAKACRLFPPPAGDGLSLRA